MAARSSLFRPSCTPSGQPAPRCRATGGSKRKYSEGSTNSDDSHTRTASPINGMLVLGCGGRGDDSGSPGRSARSKITALVDGSKDGRSGMNGRLSAAKRMMKAQHSRATGKRVEEEDMANRHRWPHLVNDYFPQSKRSGPSRQPL